MVITEYVRSVKQALTQQKEQINATHVLLDISAAKMDPPHAKFALQVPLPKDRPPHVPIARLDTTLPTMGQWIAFVVPQAPVPTEEQGKHHVHNAIMGRLPPILGPQLVPVVKRDTTLQKEQLFA